MTDLSFGLTQQTSMMTCTGYPACKSADFSQMHDRKQPATHQLSAIPSLAPFQQHSSTKESPQPQTRYFGDLATKAMKLAKLVKPLHPTPHIPLVSNLPAEAQRLIWEHAANSMLSSTMRCFLKRPSVTTLASPSLLALSFSPMGLDFF